MTKNLGTIYTWPKNPRVFKAQVAAKYAGCEVTVNDAFVMGTTNKTAEFLAKFPYGRVPAMDSVDGPIYESGAIAYYVASQKSDELLGKTPYERTLVQQFVAVADTDLIPNFCGWKYPIIGFRPYVEAAVNSSKDLFLHSLSVLDKILSTRTFLVGEAVTLADISVCCAVYDAFVMFLDAPARAKLVNLTRWFVTCVNQPNFKSVVGEVALCTKAAVYDASKVAAAAAAKAAAAKPAAPAKHDDAGDEEEEEAPKPKPKSAMDLLPPTTFNLEDWKRFYSNNETRPTAIDYFWSKYDPAGYSMWRFDYKYNDELTKIFMSCNLITGLFSRMERLHKYAFGSVIIFGEDNKNEISGIFIFRGKEMPEEMKDVADYESYNVTLLNTEDPATREIFNDFIAWDGKLEGRKFAEGKIFK